MHHPRAWIATALSCCRTSRSPGPLAGLVSVLAALATSQAVASPLIEVLTLQDSEDPIAATEELTYSVQVSNVSGSTSADGVELTVDLPAGVEFISTSNGACAHASGTVTCTLGTLAAEQDILIDIATRVVAAGGSTLEAIATATSTSPGETPSVVEQETTVVAGADLALSMLASPDPVPAGGDVTYALTIENLGPDASSGLQVVNTLPPNVTYVSSSGSGWSCSAAGSTVTCNRSGSLANGASEVLSVVGRVQSSISGTITNSASLSATTGDGLPNNNTDTAPVVHDYNSATIDGGTVKRLGRHDLRGDRHGARTRCERLDDRAAGATCLSTSGARCVRR